MDETVEVLFHFLTVFILYIMNMVLCLNGTHDHTRASELTVVLSLMFVYMYNILYSVTIILRKIRVMRASERCFI